LLKKVGFELTGMALFKNSKM
jgi:hypothetical protein